MDCTLTVRGVSEHGDGGALEVIVLCLKQFFIFISFTETVTTREWVGVYERIIGCKIKVHCSSLRRSRWVPFSLSFLKGGRCDLEWRGGSLLTTSGIHEVGKDLCLLKKKLKSLSLVLFLRGLVHAWLQRWALFRIKTQPSHLALIHDWCTLHWIQGRNSKCYINLLPISGHSLLAAELCLE